MNKNEIVARWMGKKDKDAVTCYWPDKDYNLLHEAWVKFRDLKFEDVNQLKEFKLQKDQIAYAITYWSITEAFDELVKGIEWYESLNKKQ